ncbi:hypothetical protein CKO25_08915 [Thiocapsa imhoffii]|uniref:PilZ domain-containing protein n=1 Tax=Thiocapsa imhoffii TaxID=382777 RepID=A0A9X0WIK8_9GAMM|nr:PilZ domain-containing protein [Thiocapsa imhoffii]MBK1644767.1 hypothetical protein [Thiocapsa imhoffii]
METSDAEHERRRFERKPWHHEARLLPLSAIPADPSGPVRVSGEGTASPVGMSRAACCDISEGGLQVWAEHLFVIRARLLVEMDTPDAPVGLQAIGTVVWSAPGEKEGQWVLGIEFTDIGDTARSKIKALVEPQIIRPLLDLDT